MTTKPKPDAEGAPPAPHQCPTCGSPRPDQHPWANEADGDVKICVDAWHRSVVASPAPPSETLCHCGHPASQHFIKRECVNCECEGSPAEAASPLPLATCPHCHLPAVLPEICTPEVNAAIERGIAQASDLYQAGREAASPLPRPDLLAIAIEYHKTVEGEYGCNGATCPGVKRLVALLERVASRLPRWQDISTATPDKALLLWDGLCFTLGHFNTAIGKWVANWDHHPLQPTHWWDFGSGSPLPMPPVVNR